MKKYEIYIIYHEKIKTNKVYSHSFRCVLKAKLLKLILHIIVISVITDSAKVSEKSCIAAIR